ALELIERVPDGTWPQLAGYRVAALSLLARDEDVARSGPVVLAQTADAETIGRTGWTLAYSLGRLGRFAEARGVLDGILRGSGRWRSSATVRRRPTCACCCWPTARCPW